MGLASRVRGGLGCFVVCCGLGALLAATGPVAAQDKARLPAKVSMVRQDFSDCQNGNVSDNGGLLTSGTAWLLSNNDGTTTVKIAITVNPDTTYHFFLKCVRLLGDIKTDDEGTGEAVFTFRTNEVGPVFAFDMYPEGAPAGNKFQSVQVKYQ